MAGSFRDYIHAKRIKLDDQLKDIKASGIFNNLVFYVNGYTIPSQLQLRDLIVSNGGKFMYNLDSSVTHVIATNLPDSKVKALKYQLVHFRNEIVIKPEWIVDSINEGILLPIDSYQLYKKIDVNQSKISSFPKDEVEDAISENSEEELEDEQDMNSTDNIQEPRIIDVKTANSENFISEFYKSSRLHHLSVWKLELAEFAQQLLQEFPSKHPLPMPKVYMHVDMDCFFASVSLKKRPELKDKPVGISHISSEGSSNISNSTSSIASCNYIARSFGVSNGVPIKMALEKCPNLILIPYDFEAYNDVSKQLYRHCDQIEPISCDEAYIDVSTKTTNEDEIIQFANAIKKEIYDVCGCDASIGIGHNLLLSRLATKKAKPNGIFYLKEEDVSEFMKTISVNDLPGIGWAISKQLNDCGIFTCQDLQAKSLALLQKDFGQKIGETLYERCRGIDHRKIKLKAERKSIGAEVNWGIRFENIQQAKSFFERLSKELCERMQKSKLKGKQIQLKIMQKRANSGPALKYLGHGVCDTFCRSKQIKLTYDEITIFKEAWSLYGSLNIPPEEIRGLGIHMMKLEKGTENNSTSVIQMFKPVEKLDEKSTFLKKAGIDLATYNELPKEIQEQIESEMLSKDSVSSDNNPSRLSQIDQDVLKELPESLRNEILGQFSNNREKKNVQVTPKTSKKLFKSPNNSNSKKLATTPVGRTLTQAWGIIPEKQMKGLDMDVFKDLPLNIRLEIIEKQKKENIKKQQELEDQRDKEIIDSILKESTKEPYEIRKIKISFCGLEKTDDIKQILKEWIQSEKILPEDIETFTGFLFSLVQSSELDKIYKILNYLDHITRDIDAWKYLLEDIKESLQRQVKEKFGYKMDL